MDTEIELTKKYIRKPLIVEAVQVTEENFEIVKRWCIGTVCNNNETFVNPAAPLNPATQYIRVRVHHPKNSSQTKAYVGDWILYTDRGYKVYKTRPFQENFDLLSAVQAQQDDEDEIGAFLPDHPAMRNNDEAETT